MEQDTIGKQPENHSDSCSEVPHIQAWSRIQQENNQKTTAIVAAKCRTYNHGAGYNRKTTRKPQR
jgi:hypothetical protein